MTNQLKDLTIAILATHGVEQSELQKPREALEQAGATTLLVSLESGEIKTWSGDDFGESIPVNLTLAEADVETFDALLLPGGVMSPDKLRHDAQAVEFVSEFFEAGKPIAAICHGPQILINARVVKGRTLTSFPSIKIDLINAGAKWVDEAVVVDRGLVTSRKPSDIPEFNKKMIETFSAAALTSGHHDSHRGILVL